MATRNQVPTGSMERELRKLYLQWLAGMPSDPAKLPAYVDTFQTKSLALIAEMGGQAASLGALAGFPTPRMLDLSPVAGHVYDEMKQAAIKAGIAAGLNSTDVARQMVSAGFEGGFKKLNRLARTETVSAYWRNQWNSVADLPNIVMVWGAEMSAKTCDYCQRRDGLLVEDTSIRDHPNGRCTLIPTHRALLDYKGTLMPDGSTFMDPKWTGKKAKTIDPVELGERPQAISSDAYSAPATQQGTVKTPEPQTIKGTARDEVGHVPGTDIRDTIDRDRLNQLSELQGRQHLRYIQEQQGWTGTVSQLPPGEFDKIDSPSIFRGLQSAEGRTAAELQEEFLTSSNPFIGRGVSGNGWYFGSENVAQQYSGYGEGVYGHYKLSPTARVMDYEELLKIQRELPFSLDNRAFIDDSSAIAAAMGYDAVRVPSPSIGDFYHIVLNRSALIFRGGPHG